MVFKQDVMFKQGISCGHGKERGQAGGYFIRWAKVPPKLKFWKVMVHYGECPGRNSKENSMTTTARSRHCSWSTWILKSQSRKMVADLGLTKVSILERPVLLSYS